MVSNLLCLWNHETKLISGVVPGQRTVQESVWSGLLTENVNSSCGNPTYIEECSQTIHDAMDQLDRVWHMFKPKE